MFKVAQLQVDKIQAMREVAIYEQEFSNSVKLSSEISKLSIQVSKLKNRHRKSIKKDYRSTYMALLRHDSEDEEKELRMRYREKLINWYEALQNIEISADALQTHKKLVKNSTRFPIGNLLQNHPKEFSIKPRLFKPIKTSGKFFVTHIDEEYKSVKLINGVNWWVSARFMNSLVWIILTIATQEKLYETSFSPLTRNIAELDFVKEVDRLRFDVVNNKLELKFSNTPEEISFYKLHYVIKLKGTSVFSPYNENMLSLIKIEEKGSDWIVFDGTWAFTEYTSRQK